VTAAAARVVLFDLDGTLIDSERLILASYRHTMRKHLGHVPPEETWKATIGQPLVVQMKMFADREDKVSAMIRTYVDHNLANHDDYVNPFPGVRSLVEAIRESGRVLGIVTSKKRRATHMGLARCDLPVEWFTAIVTADDVERYKPEPEPVLEALDQLGISGAEALFVGDSTHDMRCGRAAGVLTAAVLWGPYTRAQLEPTEPDVWLEEPGDLLTVLGIVS
jgi:pyrophosphatase PpaX